MTVKITTLRLRAIAPFARQSIIAGLVRYLPGALADYGIETPLRVAHFLAQAAHETAGFRTLEEYASGAAYEGRSDLGNTRPGDGRRFKGRGIFQLTGRANYRAMGERLELQLESEPELAGQPHVSVLTACEYWKTRRLGTYADRNDIRAITRRINGGYNGLAGRKRYFARAWKIYGKAAGQSRAPAHDRVLKTGGVGRAVKRLQRRLGIEADGIFGPITRRAVIRFQRHKGLVPDGLAGPRTWAALNSPPPTKNKN